MGNEKEKSLLKAYLDQEPDLINLSLKREFKYSSLDKYEIKHIIKEAGFKEVNKNQYKRINIDFNIKPSNGFFYEEKQGKIYQFLKKAEKAYINPEIALIVFRFKQEPTFNVLSINNITDTITEYELKTLDYLNKQHNLYYAIDTNKPIEYESNLNDFKNHIIKQLQKSLKHNNELIHNHFPKKAEYVKLSVINRLKS
ncbi:MAG: hypothetical protein Q8R66_07815 [Methanobacteriaceae archaeon]|nr:hypothetical protein [Methanobacteriaceae archaeon]